VKESEALIYFKDILNGFLYLSQERFIHGNLKLSSLLIKDKIVKISGLSNARKVSKDEKDAKK
jgi:serine/threonine protein kinase